MADLRASATYWADRTGSAIERLLAALQERKKSTPSQTQPNSGTTETTQDVAHNSEMELHHPITSDPGHGGQQSVDDASQNTLPTSGTKPDLWQQFIQSGEQHNLAGPKQRGDTDRNANEDEDWWEGVEKDWDISNENDEFDPDEWSNVTESDSEPSKVRLGFYSGDMKDVGTNTEEKMDRVDFRRNVQKSRYSTQTPVESCAECQRQRNTQFVLPNSDTHTAPTFKSTDTQTENITPTQALTKSTQTQTVLFYLIIP